MASTTPRSTPKDVFLHLLAIVTLYIGVISLIALLFQYIEAAFADTLTYSITRTSQAVRTAISSLIVVWPVYIGISYVIGKDFKQTPEHRHVKIRKWLVYLTLFIAAMTLIIDMIALINSFLGGELTMSFVLKVLSVLVVAGSVFGYYLWDIKRDAGDRSGLPRRMAWLSSIAIVAVIVAGFFIVGSPAHQRALRFDAERVEDLNSLQFQVIEHWRTKEALPESLDELHDDIGGYTAPTDPSTKQPYDYTVTGELSFELCATFETSSERYDTDTRGYNPGYLKSWKHGQGYECFERTIDPDDYKDLIGTTHALPVRENIY